MREGTEDCEGGASQRRASPCCQARRRSCWIAAAAVLFASLQIACSHAAPSSYPGQSYNLTATSFGPRTVSLAWIQQDNISYAAGAFYIVKFVVYNGGQVFRDDPNVTSVPCVAQNCSALQSVEIGDLILGQYYDFTVRSVYSHVEGGDLLEGKPSESVRMFVTDPPSAPRGLTASGIARGVKLSWQPPANTGIGSIWNIFYSNSTEVLRGYRLLVSTSSTYDPAGCAGGQSQSCYSSALPNWAVETSVTGLRGGLAYNIWLLAYNVPFEGDVSSLMSFTVKGLPTAPLNTVLNLEDHLVMQLTWQPPNATGAESGRGVDYYTVEWTRGDAAFSSCRAGGKLQCYSTRDIALPGGCRGCAVQTCNDGEVCFSSEVESEDGVRYMVLGCTGAQSQTGESQGDGVCGDPFSSTYYNCHFCNTPRCNNGAPAPGSVNRHFCALSGGEQYCTEELGAQSVIIAAAGPGQAFEARSVGDVACQASTQIYHHRVPANVFNLSVGSTPFSSGDVKFALENGVRYNFRVGACWNDLGCGEFSEPLSAGAARLPMTSAVEPVLKTAGQRTDVEVMLTPIKGIQESGMIQLVFPDGFVMDAQTRMSDLMSLCSAATRSPARMLADNASNGTGMYITTYAPWNVSCPNNCTGRGVCNGSQCVQPAGSHVTQATCTLNDTVSIFRVVARGQHVTVQLPEDFKASPGQPLSFRLSGIVNPGVSGRTLSVSISTLTAQGALIDENLDVPGHVLTPGALEVSVRLSKKVAGQLSNANVSVLSAGGYPAGSVFVLMTSGNFSFNGAVLSASNPALFIKRTGKDLISVIISESFAEQRLEFVVSGLLVGPVPSDTGVWQAYTELNGAKIGMDENVAGVNILAGSLELEFMETQASLAFGATVDLAMRYTHSRDLSMMPGVAVLSLQFPSGMDLSSTAFDIRGDAGSGVEEVHSYVTYNLTYDSDAHAYVLDVTFGENRTDVGMNEPFHWTIRSTGGVVMPHFRLDAPSIIARTISRHVDFNNVVVAEMAANSTTLAFEYSPGSLRQVAVGLTSSLAGALTDIALNFTLSNPLPQLATLILVTSEYVKLCDENQCQISFNTSAGAVRSVSRLMDSPTKMLISIDLQQEITAGSPLQLFVKGVRSLPWAGNVSLTVSILDDASGRTVERALNIPPLLIRSAELLSVSGELSNPFPDKLGRWDTHRPVLGTPPGDAVTCISSGCSGRGFCDTVRGRCDCHEGYGGFACEYSCVNTMPIDVDNSFSDGHNCSLPSGLVHLGIRFVSPVDVPSDSYILVRVAGARFSEVHADPAYAHKQGTGKYMASITDDGNIKLTQTRSFDSLDCLPKSGTIAFNLLVGVTVKSGSLRSVARDYEIEVHQTREHTSMSAVFQGQFRDRLLPGPAVGSRRLLSATDHALSLTTVSLSSNRAGDVADVTLNFRLLVDLSSLGSIVINLPSDARILSDTSVEKVDPSAMDGSLLVNLSSSVNSVVLNRDPFDSTPLVYGQTKTTCTTTGGSAPEGSACVFPFIYFGSPVYSCTTIDNGGVPWCSTEQYFNGKWGDCNCIDTQIDLDVSIKLRRVKLPEYSGLINFQLLVVDSTNTTDYIVAQDTVIGASLLPNLIGNVSVELGPSQAGALTNMTVKLVLFNPLPADGKLQVVFPEHFTLETPWPEIPIKARSATGEVIGVTVAWPVMNLLRSGSAAGVETMGGAEFIITVYTTCIADACSGIRVRPWSGDVEFEVRTLMGPYLKNVPVDSAKDTVTIFPNNLTDVAADLTSSIAGSKGAAAVRFRPPNAIPLHGGILITLPAHFELHDPSLDTSWKLCGVVGAANVTLENIQIERDDGSGRWQILMMLSGDQMLNKDALVEFTIPGVGIRRYSGVSAPFAIRTVTSFGAVIDHSLFGTEQKIMPDMLSAASVELLSAEAGAVSSVQVSFTISNPLPADGQIAVAFPTNFVLIYPVSNGYLTGIEGMLAVSEYAPEVNGRCPQGDMAHLGCNVTLTVEGEETPGGSSVSFGITNVGLMHLAGITGTYLVQTRTLDGAIIDEAIVNHSRVGPSKLGFAIIQPQGEMRVASNTTYKVSFTTANPVSIGSFVQVIFPPLFNLSDTCYTHGECGVVHAYGTGVTEYKVEHDRVLVSVTRNFTAEADVSFVISGIKAPPVGGFTGTYQIKTVSQSGVDIDVDLDVEQAVTSPAQMRANLGLDSEAAGDETTVVVQVNVSSPVPAQNGMFEIVLPPGSSVSSKAVVTAVSGFDGHLVLTVSGNVILLERKDARVEIGTGVVVSFSVSGVVNPPRAGSFDYVVRTKRSISSQTISGLSSDSGIVIRVLEEATLTSVIEPAGLEDAGVYPSPLAVGYRGSIRVRFRLANALPTDGIIRLDFSDGLADLSHVLTSSFMAAKMEEALVTYVDGATCTSSNASRVTVSRKSGSRISPGVFVDVEVSIVQLFGFVNYQGYIHVSTMSADEVLIDSQQVRVHLTDPGTLTQVEGRFSDCLTRLTCSGSCGCSSPQIALSGTISDGPGTYSPDEDCTWIIAAECGDLVLRFTSFDVEQTLDMVKVYECSTRDCSMQNATEVDLLTGNLNPNSIPEYRPASGFLKVVFTSDGGVQAEGFEAEWSCAYTTPRSIGSPTTAAGTEARLHLSFWTANLLPAGGMISIELPSGGHTREDRVGCHLAVGGTESELPVTVTKGVAFGIGDTLNLTVANGIASGEALEIVCSNVHERIWSGPPVYQVRTTTGHGDIIDAGACTTVASAGALQEMMLNQSERMAGYRNDLEISFRTLNRLPPNAVVEFEVPPAFHVVITDLAAIGSVGGERLTFRTTYEGGSVQMHLKDEQVLPNTLIAFKMFGVVNRNFAGGIAPIVRTRHPHRKYFDLRYDRDYSVIDEGAPGTILIDPVSIRNAAVSPAVAVAGSWVTLVVGYTLESPLPAEGTLSITFPMHFDVSMVSSTTSFLEGVDGVANVEVRGRNVTLSRVEGTVVPSGTQIRVQIVNVQVPPFEDPRGDYADICKSQPEVCLFMQTMTLSIRDPLSSPIDTAHLPPVVTQRGALSIPGTPYSGSYRRSLPSGPGNVRVFPALSRAGDLTNLQLEFWTINMVPMGGHIVFELASGFVVESYSSPQCTASENVVVTSVDVVNGTEMHLKLGAELAESVSLTIFCVGIKVQGLSGLQVRHHLYTATADVPPKVIDSGYGYTDVASGFVGATVELSTATAGSSVTLKVSASLTNHLPVFGSLEIDMPSAYSPDGFSVVSDFLAVANLSDTLLWSASDVSSGCIARVSALRRGYDYDLPTHPQGLYTLKIQTLHCSFPAATALRFNVSGLRNRGWEGPTGTYWLRTRSQSGSLIDGCDPEDLQRSVHCSDEVVAGSTLVPAIPTPATLQLEAYTAGNQGRATLIFTTKTTLYNDSVIELTFPEGFVLSPYGSLSGLHQGMDGLTSYTVHSQTRLTIVRMSGSDLLPDSTVAIQLSEVHNRKVSDCTDIGACRNSSGEVKLRLATIAGATTDVTSLVLDALKVAYLRETNVEPSALVAGSLGHVVVTFRLANLLPADGKIFVDFPPGVSLVAPLIVQNILGMDGLFAVSTTGERRVIIDRVGGTLVHSDRTVQFNLTGVRNRVFSGESGTYQIRTATVDGTLIDADLEVSSDFLKPGEIQNVRMRPDSLIAGVTSKLVVTFAVANPLPANGGIELTLPNGFTFPTYFTLADGVIDLATAARAVRVNHTAYSILEGDGQFMLEFHDDRTVVLWRTRAHNATMPCNYSKPEFELRRDIISPGCTGLDDLYSDCSISFAFENITTRHISGKSSIYRLRTLLADHTIVDEAYVDAHEVTNGLLLGTRVDPASHVAGKRTTALVTMLASNGLPADGKVEVMFPEGFDVRGLTLGKSSSSMLIAEGGVLVAEDVPKFLNVRASTNSRVLADMSRVSVSFEMNFEPEIGTAIILGNLGDSITRSTSTLDSGGVDRSMFGPAAWSKQSGEISITVITNIPTGHVVRLWFDLQNPNSSTTNGVHPTIRSVPPSCGFQCASMPAAKADLGGEEVLHVNTTAQSLKKSIESGNPVAGELVTVSTQLQFNFALRLGHRVIISGLNGTGTTDNANLSVVGPAAAWFKYGGLWRQTQGSLSLEVWEMVPADTVIELGFVLLNSALARDGVVPKLEVEGNDESYVEVAPHTMDAQGVLRVLSTEAPKFAVKMIGQNTVSFNAFNRVTITLRPTVVLTSGTKITISGLVASQTGGTSLAVWGKDASSFETTASWNGASGSLILTVAPGGGPQSANPGLRDDRESVFYVMLQNPANIHPGSQPYIECDHLGFESKIMMDGITLRTQSSGNFTKATITYSTNRAFMRNQVYLSLTPSANLPAGSTITVTKLPIDSESNASCLGETVHNLPCHFPFEWAGQMWTKCVTNSAAVSGGVITPLNQGLPWCPTHGAFLETLTNQTRDIGQYNTSYINQELGSKWSYCRCDSLNNKILLGDDAELFNRVATWDAAKSTLTLTLAPGKEISAGQQVDVSFQIRNPGVQVESGLPDYLWARIAAKVVDPYIEADCSSIDILPNRSLGWGLSRFVADGIGQDVAGVLIINVTEIPNVVDPSQERLKVHYCYFEVGSFGNLYGFSPMVEVRDGGLLSTGRQRVEAEELVIKPHGCSLAVVEGNANVSSTIKVDSDPKWVVSSLGIGSNHYGALSSITVTLQPNWELEHPTDITVCCVEGYQVPNPDDGDEIAVFNEGGAYFGFKGKFDKATGVVTLRIVDGMTVPCNKSTTISFKLRNFRDRSSLQLPGNLTAMGPLGFFGSSLSAPQQAPASTPTGFHWVYKHAADTSAAFGTLNLITVTLQPSQEVFYPSRITIGNLLGSTTPTNRNPGFTKTQSHPLTLMGAGAFHFSKGEWVNDLDACGSLNQLDCVDSDARLILHVEGWVPSASPTVVSFYLRNKPFFVEGRVPTISISGFVCNTTSALSSSQPECTIEELAETMHAKPILEASSPAGFSTLSVSTSTRVVGAMSTITVSMQPNWYIEDGTLLTLTGMSDTCPDSAAYFEPPAYCQNVQNPSASMSLQGASQGIFGGAGSWNSLTGQLVLTVQHAAGIAAGSEVEVKFNLRNKGVFFKGVSVGLKIPIFGSELADGVLMEREMRSITVQRTGQGRAIQPGESLTFTLQHIRVPGHAGPTGTYQLRTMLGDGTLLDQDLRVQPTIIQPAQLEARMTMTPRIAGARGDVLVEMSTSNPLPSGGTVHVWFPNGFQLDTGHWDVILNDDYIKGGRAGLQVESNSGNFTVHIATEGTQFMETGLGLTFNWPTSAIITNVGSELPAWQRWTFTLKGVQFPMASVVRAVGAGGSSGTYQVRTFTEDNAVIDQDLDVPGGANFDPGTLLQSEVRPGSVVAGDVSDLTIAFVTFNPMTVDARIELTLPEGFTFAGDPDHADLDGYGSVGPWSADYGLDYKVVKSPGVAMPVGATRARMLQVEILDKSMEGNLTMTLHDARRCTFWRRAETTVPRHTRVRFRVFDPTSDFEVLAPVLGVRNPSVAGPTGTFEIRVRLYDSTLVDQDLSVSPVHIVPGTLSNVYIGPTNPTTGSVSDLRISFKVHNPLPVNGSIRVTLPFEELSVVSLPTAPVPGLDALDGWVNVSLETAADGVESILLRRVNGATTVSPCIKPVCNSENIVSMRVPEAFQSSWRRPPSYAAYAFAADGTSWVSGPSLPHWVQYDFGRAVSVCSYSFQSRPSDILGYLRADGPTSYHLFGSLDGTTFTKLHEIINGSEWSTGDEERSHLLHTNSYFRYFRLTVTGVPGRLTGNKYAVIRNLRLTAPTGADPHSSLQEHQQCVVTVSIPNLVRNRRFAGLTNPYSIATYDSRGLISDHELQARGSQVTPSPLQDASVVPSSTLAGEVVTMRVSFTPLNEIPPNGHIEVVFPEGIDLSMLPTTPQVGLFAETTIFENFGGSQPGNVVVRVTGQAVQIVRDNSGGTIPAGASLSLLLTNIRNVPFPGLGGTYIVRSKVHESVSDHNESVAATLFTTQSFQGLTLNVSTNIAGGLGPVRLSFVPMNPIPADGRVHIKLPDEYVLLHPLHAEWIEGADGFLTTTVEPDGSILMSRDAEHDAPRHVRMVIEFSTVINVPRSGDALTFRMCTQLHDRRPIDCAAPDCTGCEAEVSPVLPHVMLPAQLINASVLPDSEGSCDSCEQQELYVTGKEGLVVSFTTVNALVNNSILQLSVPAAFRPEGGYWANFSFEHADCYQSNNPPNNTVAPIPLLDAGYAPAELDVSVDSSMTSHHVVSITLPKLVRATRVRAIVYGIRSPLCKGPSGTFQLTIRNPDGVVVDEDLDIPSVNIVQGLLTSVSVSADRLVAGDMIALTLRFSSLNNPIPALGYVDITLPASFYACPCNLIDTSQVSGAGSMSCQQLYCKPDNEIRPDFVQVMSDGNVKLNQGNLTWKAVDSNGTLIRLRLLEPMFGDIELQLRNIRSQNFSGPTGTFQIQSRCQNGELIDENLAVPGYTLQTAGPGYITDTKVTVMEPTAGGRGRVLVEFVPYNPLPPGSMIAIVLPVGFQVSTNSSVAQPLGNSASEANYLKEEWDEGVSIDGDLEVEVYGDVLVTVSRRGSMVSTPPHTRVAFFVDMVRNPQRSGTTGTFQLRTLLSSGVPIDEDLEVKGVRINPGNFTGVCPPFCLMPEVKPTSLLAGSRVNMSVAFYVSNPLPSDGQIEVQLHANSGFFGDVRVSAGSILDDARESLERVGPILDGGLIVFVHGKTVRVRRDGTGRRIEVGEMVSLTIEGVQNQEDEGNTGVAHLTTKQGDGTVIDESVIPGHVLVPIEFTDFLLSKDVLTAGKLSTMFISLSTSGPIKPESKLIVDFSNEVQLTATFEPLDASSLNVDSASSSTWGLSIEDGVRLVLVYRGAEAIPGGVRTDISVSNIPNPPVANPVVYLLSLLAPGSTDSTDVYRSFQYEVGGLSEVSMMPVSFLAGYTGAFTVRFRILNPLPGNGIVEVELPSTFAFTDTVSALVTGSSGMDGILVVTRVSRTHVSLQRVLGGVVPAGGIAEMVLYNVRNQEFSGVTPRLSITTRTFDSVLIDTGKSSPIVLSVASLDAVSVTFETSVVAAVEKATLRLRTGSPIPDDGQLLIQFPAGTQILDPPEYMSLMGVPVRVKVYPGTPGGLDVRLYNGQAAADPYFAFNTTHAQAPTAVHPGMLRGASVLLSRLGGGYSIPANSNVIFEMPNVKVRPWSGFSGTFQVMTMLNTFELIDQDRDVQGVTLHPGTLKDVVITVSSLVSGVAVRVAVNMTLSVSLPPTSEIHVMFPAGYRTIEYAKVESQDGLIGVLEPIGVVSVAGGATVLKLRHTAASVTPEGTKVFLLLSDVENRFFSSRSQYFQLDTYRSDGVTHLERSEGILVPSVSNSPGAPGFGIVVESNLVMMFDTHDPSQAVSIVTLEEGAGCMTHGVSAVDREGDAVYFIAEGKLMALELASPTVVSVPLNTGAENMLGFVSMEWDSTHQRLVGLALVDGELMLATVDTVSGNVSRISDLAACGTCECSPSQGVSALDTARGVYYFASQVTLMAVDSSSGVLVSQTSVVQGEDGFLGFASLEFDGEGHHPRYMPMGLMGVALRGDVVELVQINADTGSMKVIATIFDEIFTGQIVGGISSLTPSRSHYMLLAQSRLLAVDLETHVVSHHSPYSATASGGWAFLEISSFLPPLGGHVYAETGGDNSNAAQRPTDVSELNITVVGLEESLPVKRGSIASGNYFSVRLVGSDVRIGDRMQVSPAGDCSTVLPGGGPYDIMSNGMYLQRFYLELDDAGPSHAQLCYSRQDGFDAAFRPLPYSGAVGSWLVEFATTMAFFSVNAAPVPVGESVSLTLSGALAAGDTFRIIMDDGSIHPEDLCLRAPQYPGTEPVAVVSIDPQQTRTYAFGAVTDIVADLILEDGKGVALGICYRPAGSSTYSLIRGQQRASAADSWLHATFISVDEGDMSSAPTCSAAPASSSSIAGGSSAYL